MLSILIPTYNYNVFPLVESLFLQAIELNITFEILVFDDGSSDPAEENKRINSLNNCQYTLHKLNKGRSAIRNELARSAKHEMLLFLDADVEIIRTDFISEYLKAINENSQIIYGGIVYSMTPPDHDHQLRWVYGKAREAIALKERLTQPYLRFLTLNFLIRKSVFSHIAFNEDIPNLRHEDTLFAMDAKNENINIQHIDNTVVHLGLETNSEFLKKSIESVESLHDFVSKGLLQSNDVQLSKVAIKINSFRVGWLIRGIYKFFQPLMKKNLESGKPSLFIFDIYRLGYYLILD